MKKDGVPLGESTAGLRINPRGKASMKPNRKRESGSTLVAAVVALAVLGVAVTFGLRLVRTNVQQLASITYRQELNEVARTVFNRLSCSSTLSQVGTLRDEDCSEDIHTQSGPLFSLRDANGDLVTDDYNTRQQWGTLGKYWNLRASCFLKRTGTAAPKRCVLVHAASLTPSGPRLDPFTKKPLDFSPLVDTAYCCDEASIGSPPSSATCPNVITFESLPSGASAEQTSISNQFSASHGVEFCRLSASGNCDGPAVLAKVGAPTGAFMGYAGQPDKPNPQAASLVENYFLTGEYAPARQEKGILVRFNSPVAEVSGLALNVTGNRNFYVIARNVAGREIDRVTMRGLNTNGPGFTQSWSITRRNASIASLSMYSDQGGFSLDRFSPGKVCEPPPVPPKTEQYRLYVNHTPGAGDANSSPWIKVTGNFVAPVSTPTDDMLCQPFAGKSRWCGELRVREESQVTLTTDYSAPGGTAKHQKFAYWIVSSYPIYTYGCTTLKLSEQQRMANGETFIWPIQCRCERAITLPPAPNGAQIYATAVWQDDSLPRTPCP